MPKIDPRFLVTSSDEVFIGNELLVKGCLETEGGVGLMSGYPGSPVAGFFDCIGDIASLLNEKGVRAFQANNEALGVAAMNGSQMAGVKAIVAMKSVGLHVASDALAIGNLAGAHPDGGCVVICGDDPWCDSTQVPADSRFLLEHLRMPVVEPGSTQEVKDWINACFKLSQVAGLYIGYVVTTAQADGGGTVSCRPNHFPAINTREKFELDTSKLELDRTVLLPPRTWIKELGIGERLDATMRKARELGINSIVERSPLSSRMEGASSSNSRAPMGFITTGMSRPYLEQVLATVGLTGEFPILNMGMSYPADVQLVREFAELCDQMIVIEERRSFLEKNIRDGLFREFSHEQAGELSSRLFGKTFPKRGRGFQPLRKDERVTESTTPGAFAQGLEAPATRGIPETRGLNPSLLATLILPLIQQTEAVPAHLRNGNLTAELDLLKKLSKPRLDILGEQKLAVRTPTFCPGCPHRDSSATLLEIRKNFADAAYMKRYHDRAPVDLVAHGDTGCYTMLMFAPTEQLMHNYSGMGLGGGTGSGIDSFINNKQLVFMGDGTFFHSGQVAISNAVKNGQDICFIILENGTTAMTGHQEHPGTEIDVLGNTTWLQDIHAIVKSMKGTSPLTVVKLDPADRDAYKKTLEATILADGVKVIIADKECGITLNRTKGREERKVITAKGYLPIKEHMNVTPEVCENCLECTKATACPGLIPAETDYGMKIDTDLTWCVNDGACERVRTSNDYGTSVKPCPSFEQVKIIRNKRPRYMLPKMDLAKLPEPVRVQKLDQAGEMWRVHMAGVGGMGIGVVGAILIRAGHREGHRVVFADKKGLAIRNGGVYSQICWIGQEQKESPASDDTQNRGRGFQPLRKTERATESTTPVAFAQGLEAPATMQTTGLIPYGRADLLLGVDILEAARAIDPRESFRVASPDRTAAVLNLHKQPTVYTLIGKDDFDPLKLREQIYQQCDTEHSYARDLSELCEQRLGSKQFVNIMMLGVAFQLGLIPVSSSSIGWAIRDTIRRDQRRNMKAFNIGRKLALEPRALTSRPEPTTWQQLLTQKMKILRKTRRNGEVLANDLETLVKSAIESMPSLPENLKYDVTVRLYDLTQYADLAFAKRYLALVRKIYASDSSRHDYHASRHAIWGIAKVMLIKDEPYVAYLLTRYEKKQRDLIKYGIDAANGDRITYRHHTSPEFNVGPWRIRFKITTTDWMLAVMAKMKWLRALPGWHKRETAFRDWYIGLLDRVRLGNDGDYDQAVMALSCYDGVTGYREVRYPKMDRAKAFVEELLLNKPGIEVTIHPAGKGAGVTTRETQDAVR